MAPNTEAESSVPVSGRRKNVLLFGLAGLAILLLALSMLASGRQVDERERDALISRLTAMTSPTGRSTAPRDDGGVEFQGWMEDGKLNEELSRMVEESVDSMGFQRLTESSLNPGMRHSSEWSSYVDATTTPPSNVEQWDREWTNDGGDIISFFLQRKYGVPTGNGRCKMILIYESASAAKRYRFTVGLFSLKVRLFGK